MGRRGASASRHRTNERSDATGARSAAKSAPGPDGARSTCDLGCLSIESAGEAAQIPGKPLVVSVAGVKPYRDRFDESKRMS